jgi:GT2 family glycosyltransferase
MKDLSIIIVNWNTSQNLKKCLNSIKKYKLGMSFEIYVVDNSSSDNSIKMVKKNFPDVKLIANKENNGFAGANNQVLKTVKSKYVFTVNPDIEFMPNTVKNLLTFLKTNKKTVACSPLMLNPDRTVQKKGYYHRFPSLIQALLFYTNLVKISKKITWLKYKYWESPFDLKHPFEVDQLPGACVFAYRTKLKEVGFFDERYPLLFEDVDLSYKLKKRGYDLFVVPESKIIHEGGASFKKLDDGIAQRKFLTGLLVFFDIHKSLLEKIIIRPDDNFF